MPPGADPVRLWVVVPAWNEQAGIAGTIAALAAQRDRDFQLVVVDNASTDATVVEVERACAAYGLGVTVVTEVRKGTGAAADTGVRHAIAHGATHVLRTDADTLPAPGWTTVARQAFGAGADLVTGPMRARTDEVRLRPHPYEFALYFDI